MDSYKYLDILTIYPGGGWIYTVVFRDGKNCVPCQSFLGFIRAKKLIKKISDKFQISINPVSDYYESTTFIVFDSIFDIVNYFFSMIFPILFILVFFLMAITSFKIQIY